MIFEQHRVAVTPFRSGFRVGSTMEFAGYDESIRPERLALLTEGAAFYFKDDLRLGAAEPWFGWRPMTPDGRPFIGYAPARKNVMVAAGHNMIGMSTGPGTGRLVSEMMSDGRPNFDPSPFAVDRPLI
jgi:D-amino-acid dehydrogenase